MPEGTYNITYEPPVGSGYQGFVDRDESITANRSIYVLLTPSGGLVTFSGVVRGLGGVPLAGVTLYLQGGGGTSTTTASHGSFSMSVAPGTYQLTVQKSGVYEPGVAPFDFSFRNAEVKRTENVQENLTLPLHLLTINTLGAGGTPISGVYLQGVGEEYIGPGTPAGELAPGITATDLAIAIESNKTDENGVTAVTVPTYYGEHTLAATPPSDTELSITQVSIRNIREDETKILAYTYYDCSRG